jgi:hypothetical protein
MDAFKADEDRFIVIRVPLMMPKLIELKKCIHFFKNDQALLPFVISTSRSYVQNRFNKRYSVEKTKFQFDIYGG